MDDDHYGKVQEERHDEACFEIVVGHRGLGHPDEESAAPKRANACRCCTPLVHRRPTSCSLTWRESHSERSGVVSEPVHSIGHSLHISSAKVLDQGRPCAIASPPVPSGCGAFFGAVKARVRKSTADFLSGAKGRDATAGPRPRTCSFRSRVVQSSCG